ncbi:ATP-binding cassette domain-containing protein [Nesterenkonia sp. E16_7]|uniref:ABC transporter ATP-binding protein n=1 Tax=unclassified Nesterenkonia TaxID=2629769 RepID=UPI001A910DCC|nr:MULTISPECIES: ATP-binding cassette domain-containing protein [unclassified Nesterenkonia]MBO0594389.1 ATP-binding cassette domain-containing protein [Nesterenkonia sp. E16_10]MBO0598332.1 ATP-binding cassette domain-containing protein [Nesterenkonia sp. E16_7]
MIEFRQVTKTYPDGTAAVQDFSLTVPSHTTTVLLGSSGCGKTTLLRMVNRMVEPSTGAVLIDDEDVAQAEPVALRRRIGYVMQHSGLLPHRRVIDNIATVPRLNGASRADARARGYELMEVVGLDASLGVRYPGQLSGGQQQRVGVARGLASDPNILLMDEPFGAVDPLVRVELQRELSRVQAELKKTIIFVTHDIDEALTLGDQIVVLKAGGEVAAAGTPAELVQNQQDEFVSRFLGLDSGRRSLTAATADDGGWLISDAQGRPLGLVDSQPEPARSNGVRTSADQTNADQTNPSQHP